MAAALTTDVLQDDLAVSLARVVASANRRAREAGVEAAQSYLSMTQRVEDGELFWRVNYGPKETIGRRGGDFIVDVDPSDGRIRQVLRGQ